MKRFIFSKYTKFTAAVLIVVCFMLAMYSIIGVVDKLNCEEPLVYGFENSFESTHRFDYMLTMPESVVAEVYRTFGEAAEQDKLSSAPITVKGLTFQEYLEERLNAFSFEYVNYYISIENIIYTNCGASSVEEVCDAEYHFTATRNEDGEFSYNYLPMVDYIYPEITNVNSTYLGNDVISIATSVDDGYVEECREAWNRQESLVREGFFEVLRYLIAVFLLSVYLISASGKNKDGENCPMWIDSIWTEIHLGVVFGSGIGVAAMCIWLFEAYLFNDGFPYYLMNALLLTVTAVGVVLIMSSGLSLIRKIKCRTFVKTSFICLVLIWGCKIAWLILKFIASRVNKFVKAIISLMSAKTGVIIGILMLIYTAIIGFCGVLLPESPVFLFAALIFFGVALFFIGVRSEDIDAVKRGASEIRRGDLSYKIPKSKCEDMRELAENINDIGEGLNESVSAKLKAERMKTELITNVSHDLKTPLTSIISYTELLSKVEGMPEEASDYIRIIAQKSNRLKNLTQDLFDISKVQSGNESVELEKLDVSLLINQSLGEHDNEIKNSGLRFCVDVDKELYITADGRKMSRVISNLISNILKYTMKNTRVFISAHAKDEEVVIEFKNIASYPMEFDEDEIIGRFVRGDKSRSVEGNGLGLAIAKNYVELCGGRFDVVIDGDLFKAIIAFETTE